jgi:uncharacterized protein with GYD domain
MPTYIIMAKWTSQGLQNLKQSPSRLDAARKAYAAVGIKMMAFFMTTGRYDMIAILEAADDVTFAKALLANASQGSFTTETCRAFTEDEYRQIVAGLP